MNLLVSLNNKYLHLLKTMLLSFHDSHQKEIINCYVVSDSITHDDLKKINALLTNKINFTLINYQNDTLDKAKTTYRYPKEIYYRLFAKEYLPTTVDRILYLDVDIIVLKNLTTLYNTNFNNNFFVGSTNIKKTLTKFNNIKNQAANDAHYLNTGVLLINVDLLREKQDILALEKYIIKNEHRLFLPDQDVLNALYGNRVILIDHLIYNLSDRAINKHNIRLKRTFKIDYEWVLKRAHILHFYGKNKPWNDNYKGLLKPFYDKYQMLIED